MKTLLVVLMLAGTAMAQMSVEEAEARLKMRQAARATTRPTTLPSAIASVLAEDAARSGQMESLLIQRNPKQADSFAGIVFDPYWNSGWAAQPEIFGMRMRGNGSSGSGSSGRDDFYVKGYYRSNGTYVSGYYRSRPDGIKSNNRNSK